jgi:hypothetical protein
MTFSLETQLSGKPPGNPIYPSPSTVGFIFVSPLNRQQVGNIIDLSGWQFLQNIRQIFRWVD